MTFSAVRPLKLTSVRVLMTAIATIALRCPFVPAVAIQTQRILVLSLEAPTGQTVIKVHLTTKTLGDVTLLAGQFAKHILRVRIGMTGLTTVDINGSKLLLALMAFSTGGFFVPTV